MASSDTQKIPKGQGVSDVKDVMASPDMQKRGVSDIKVVVEPNVWRTLGRLLHETIYIVFFIGLHWVIKWWLVKTHQDQDWWAQYLLTASIVFAIIAFTVIFGCELVVDCKHAIRFAYNELWKKHNV